MRSEEDRKQAGQEAILNNIKPVVLAFGGTAKLATALGLAALALRFEEIPCPPPSRKTSP